MSNTITDPGPDRGEPLTEPLPSAQGAPLPLTGFAAGITGAALLVAGVWGLHVLSSAGGVSLSVGSVVLLLAAFSALGKGITLLQRALNPITAVAAMAVSGVPALARALTTIVVGAVGIWWVMRGHAATWWAHTTATGPGWTLISALVQVTIIATAGALLFGGAKNLAGLWVPSLGPKRRGGADLAVRPYRDRWASWWSTRPGLGLMLLAGAATVVALSGYIVPRVTGWLFGSDRLAAVATIAAILIAGLLANTCWWGALSGWWAWAHRPHNPGGGTTPMGQMRAGAAVVVLLWFSATAFGLAVPDSYTGPGAVPRAHADCPPDCGGGSSGSGSSGPAFPMQPPDMPSPPGGYNGGSYPAPDQANGISIYNPSQQSPGSQGGYPQYPQQGQPGPPANGVQPPNYDAPPQAQAPAPQQGTPGGQQAPANGVQPPNYDAPAQGSAPQQAPSVPQQPAAQQPGQAPQQQPVQQGPAQQQPRQGPAQQGPQQPDGQQPQGQPGQQNQPAQQQPQQPVQQRQNTNQQLPKFPSKDKKQDDKKNQDRDSQSGDTDLSTLLFGAVSSSRRRKQDQGPDEPQKPDEQERGPDTQALAQDGAQAAQGIPGDVQTYVQSGQQIGESAGQAAQGFGEAGQAGASLASSAQSGAVNPQDVQGLIQGTAQGVQSTADAVNAGSQIVKTAQRAADQVAQAVGDASPQLKPQAEQFTQLNDQTSQVTDLVGQGAQLTSQGAGAVNTVSSLGAGGTPDMGGTGDVSGTASAAGPQAQRIELQSGDVPAAPVLGGSAPEGPASGPGVPASQDEIQQLLDQAIVDRHQQAQSLQQAFDHAAAQGYVHGPGTSDFDSAAAQAGQLRGPLAQLYGDIGALSHSADSVGGLQSTLQDGTGTLFDPVEHVPVHVPRRRTDQRQLPRSGTGPSDPGAAALSGDDDRARRMGRRQRHQCVVVPRWRRNGRQRHHRERALPRQHRGDHPSHQCGRAARREPGRRQRFPRRLRPTTRRSGQRSGQGGLFLNEYRDALRRCA
ncbi:MULTISPECIES: hypothetical protein [unclassified Mycobacterium]|uniref:hypothetical protein n=1 Tax=unclassified Mycobacterium TaxID=2642494 RepID=UPI000A64BC95|nr:MULTISPECIES: hypothetical protein [unclassified Mycobacterium]